MDFVGTPCQTPVPLEDETLQEEDCGDYIRRRVSYWTAKGDRCFAYLLLPKNISEPAPAVINFHGTVTSAKNSYVGLDLEMANRDYSVHLVRRGYVCLAPDYFCASERLKSKERPYDKTSLYKQYPQ